MARPKKPRYFNEVKLEDNLFPDPKKRAGKWQYLRPDGTKKGFDAETVHEANAIAMAANAERDTYVPAKKEAGLTIIGQLVEDYILYRARVNPEIKGKTSWKNREYALRQFGRQFDMPPSRLNRDHILNWWNTLSFNVQKLRHAEFRKAFNYWQGRGLFKQFKYNPFTTADDRPRLYIKSKPARQRLRLDKVGFWAIYNAAGELGYEGLQIAMGLSLLTFMREGDILQLKVSSSEDVLKVVIAKSAAQKGHTKATRLSWDTTRYELLHQIINRGRELSLRNQRCPYLVSYLTPRKDREYRSTKKIHKSQMTKRQLCDQFAECRDITGRWSNIPAGRTPPTFHEIRSLADAMALSLGYEKTDVQEVMAHSSLSQTLEYAAEQDMPYEPVEIMFTEEMIGGSFN